MSGVIKRTTLVSVVSGPVRENGDGTTSIRSSGTTFAVPDYDQALTAVEIALRIARKHDIEAWVHFQSGLAGSSGVIVVACKPCFMFTVEGFIGNQLKPEASDSRGDSSTLVPCRDNHAEQERFADFG